jgi:hypothetical protein
MCLSGPLTTTDASIFPTTLEGKYAIESKFTVTIKVGTPCQPMRLVVDMASTGLTTKLPLPMISRSFSPAMGGSDIIHFANHNFRVPVTVDGLNAKAASLMCSDCDGSIGIGPGSKLWLYFQDAIFTPGSVILEEPLIAYTSLSGTSDRGWFNCLPAMPNICTVSDPGLRVTTGFKTDSLVGRVTMTGMTLMFGLASQVTIVPQPIYQAYTQGRNIQLNSDPNEWPDIEFKIPASAGGGNRNSVTLRAEDIVTRSRRTGYDLLLAPGPVGSTTVVFGISAWRSMMLRRRMDTGEAQVISWQSRKHWSTYALVMLYIVPIMFVFWKLSPAGSWKVAGQAPTYGPMWKILCSGFAALIGMLTYGLPNTQQALEGSLDFNIFLGCTLGLSILWQIFAAVAYLSGGAGGVLGYYVVYSEKRTNLDNPSTVGLFLPKPDMAPLREPAANDLPTPLVYLTPRLWVIMAVANETVIILTMILILIERRAESFGSFFVLLASLFLIFNLVYYAIIAFFVSTGNDSGSVDYNVDYRSKGSRKRWGFEGVRAKKTRWSFVWLLFWVCTAVVIIASFVFVEIHVMQPFIERHILRFPRVSPYISVFVYASALILAIRWANHRVIYEELTKAKMIHEYRQRNL